MNRNVKLAVFFVLGALIVSAASAYVLLSPRRTWVSAPTLIVDSRGNASITDSDGGGTAVVNALNSSSAWNGAGTGTRLNAVRGSVASWRLGDGLPMLNFRDPERACKGTCLAATFTGFYTGGRITDADIVTNTRNSLTSLREADGCSGEYYVEGIMVHEVGHLLGLAHSNVSGSTMYPSVSACNNGPASVEADDRAAINDLY